MNTVITNFLTNALTATLLEDFLNPKCILNLNSTETLAKI